MSKRKRGRTAKAQASSAK